MTELSPLTLAAENSLGWFWPGADAAVATPKGGRTLLLEGATPRVEGAFGVGSHALRLEEGTTNLVPNPSLEVDASNWVVIGGSMARVTSGAHVGAASLECITAQGQGARTAALTLTGGQAYTASAWVRASSGTGAVRLAFWNSAFTVVASATVIANSEWQRVLVTYTPGSTGTHYVVVQNVSGAALTFGVDAVQAEAKAYATSYADGSLGTGYSWSGTAHASASTRAASRVQSPRGALDALQGAVACWVVPGWASDAAPSTPRIWRCAASASEALALTFDHTNERWSFAATAGGSTEGVTLGDTFEAGEPRLLVASWTPQRLELHAGSAGGAVSSAAFVRTTYVPALDGARCEIGSLDGASGHANAAVGPLLASERPLSSEAVAALARLERPPRWTDFG